MKWEEMKLGDVVEIIDGDRGKNYPKQNEFFENEYCIFLNTGNVTSDGFNFSKIQFITEEKDKMLRKGKLSRGDLVYTSRGTIGNVAIYSDNIPFDNLRINSGMVILRVKKEIIDNRFIYQLLKSDFQKCIMSQHITGSAQPQLPIKNMSQIKIPIPPLKTQNLISAVLSAYDKLIENNQHKIKLLEDAAQRIYREWFIKLKFPGHEEVKVVDGLPEGWELKTLEEVCEITMGQSPESVFYNENGDGLPFHQGVTNFEDRFVTNEIYCTKKSKLAEPYDILCSVRAPVGRLNITREKMIIGRGLSALRNKFDSQSFQYYQLKNFFFREDIIGGGAIFASVTRKQFGEQLMVKPSENLLKQFETIGRDIDRKIDILDLQNRQLGQARDQLLPKLMSGAIEV